VHEYVVFFLYISLLILSLGSMRVTKTGNIVSLLHA